MKKQNPTGFIALCQCGAIQAALDYQQTGRQETGRICGQWLANGLTIKPMFGGSWSATLASCTCDAPPMQSSRERFEAFYTSKGWLEERLERYPEGEYKDNYVRDLFACWCAGRTADFASELNLLKTARCPVQNCDNCGTITSVGRGGEAEPEQCEWCFHRERAVVALQPATSSTQPNGGAEREYEDELQRSASAPPGFKKLGTLHYPKNGGDPTYEPILSSASAEAGALKAVMDLTPSLESMRVLPEPIEQYLDKKRWVVGGHEPESSHAVIPMADVRPLIHFLLNTRPAAPIAPEVDTNLIDRLKGYAACVREEGRDQLHSDLQRAISFLAGFSMVPVGGGPFPVNIEQERNDFEGYILNNRMDNPKGGAMRRSNFGENAYEDPRLTVGFDCWLQRAKRDPLYTRPQAPMPEAGEVDSLAQFIRQIDGNNTMGAGTLAEKIVEWLRFNSTGSTQSDGAACFDCRLTYGAPGWIEGVIPDKVWNRIRPEGAAEGAGLLCICCISKRLAAIGAHSIPVWLCGTEPLQARSADPGSEIKLLREFDIPVADKEPCELCEKLHPVCGAYIDHEHAAINGCGGSVELASGDPAPCSHNADCHAVAVAAEPAWLDIPAFLRKNQRCKHGELLYGRRCIKCDREQDKTMNSGTGEKRAALVPDVANPALWCFCKESKPTAENLCATCGRQTSKMPVAPRTSHEFADNNEPKGTKVIYAHPNKGYLNHKERAAAYLKVGEAYTIESTDEGSWHTDFYLQEFPGISFNSVLFCNAACQRCAAERDGGVPA
jgi:hypothetical protein